MTAPNTRPVPTAPTDADILAERERAKFAMPFAPNPAAVAAYHAAPSEFPDPAADELATLRADNDARGQVIERLRAELSTANRRNEVIAAELDTVRSERDAAREELTDAIEQRDEARAAFHRTDCDRDRYRVAHNRTLRALNAALGEP